MSLKEIRDNFRLSGTRVIRKPVDKVYEMLINPEEQEKWNSQYGKPLNGFEHSIKSGDEVTVFSNSLGKKKLTYQHVKPNVEFTLHTKLKLFDWINLGDSYHTYGLDQAGENTEVTQLLIFQPSRVGAAFKSFICKDFRKVINISFDDFQLYAERNVKGKVQILYLK